MQRRIALTREVSPALGRCELTHLDRVPIDVARAVAQHALYQEALRRLGCEVHCLPAEAELPDSAFVEDAAVVLPEIALLTRPGAESRRAEVESIAAALRPWRETVRVEAPATLDGGDVVVLGRQLFIGLSSRTSSAAVEQVGAHLAPFGYEVRGVPLRDCLHLKSGACAVGEDVVLVQPRWVEARAFGAAEPIAVDERELFAANAARVGDAVIYPTAFPRTRAILEERGIEVVAVDADELAKAEGGVSCCSLVFESRRSGAPGVPGAGAGTTEAMSGHRR